MEELPLVTVNILSYNRKDELRNTLTKVYEQDYKNIDVIVVDNASSDGSPIMVEKEFPNVILIKMPKNVGIAGWNEGFKLAKGEYVLVLDDDSYPDLTTIWSGIATMKRELKIGVVAFNIHNTRFNKSETQDFLEYNPYLFNGCGALIKREIIKKVGYYDDNIFIYLNELDYTIRVYNAGYKIKYQKDNIVFHSQSKLGREDNEQNPFISKFRFYHYFLGNYIFLLKHFRLNSFFCYSGKWMLNRLIICFRYPFFFTFLRSILKIILITPRLFKTRKVVDYTIQNYYKFGKMPLIDRWYFPNFRKETFL